MSVKPILFNTEMVRAILDGRKSCTRRICKDANEYTVPDMEFYDADKRTYAVHNFADLEHTEKLSIGERTCPICPGDILYVRETWERFECWNCEGDERGNCPNEPQKSVLDKHSCGCYMYRATNEISGDAKWHPSIHMPKEAARIWLKVTDVRVERLQDITEDGAKAEGMPDDLDYPVDKAYCPLCKGEGIIGTVDANSLGHMDVDCPYCDSYRKRFENLWNSINQKCLDRYGWQANPWVWVIEFERCDKTEREE